VIVNNNELLVVSPVESHVAKVLEHAVVRMTYHMYLSMTEAALWTPCPQRMLRVRRIARQSLLHLLVDAHINLDASFSSTLDGLVETPLLVEECRTTKKQFRRKPPVGNIDHLSGFLDSDRNCPKIITAVDVPFDLVSLTLWEEGIETMLVAYALAFLVGRFLMLLIVAMVGIEKIAYLTDLVLEMNGVNFRIMQLRILLMCQVLVRVSDHSTYLEASRVTYAWQVPRRWTPGESRLLLWLFIGN
jgi:hypothetical protein